MLNHIISSVHNYSVECMTRSFDQGKYICFRHQIFGSKKLELYLGVDVKSFSKMLNTLTKFIEYD
jgi:hypothetical protein